MLRFLVLAGDDNAQSLAIFGLVGDTHCRIRGIDTLPAWSRGTKDVNTQVSRIDIHFHLFGLRQNGHSYCRSMDTSLGFCGGDTLDAVCATFKLELAIDVFALYSSDHLFEAPGFRRAGIHDFHPPALGVRIPTIHPKQVCRKERYLIPASASPDLHNDATLVIGIPWEQ